MSAWEVQRWQLIHWPEEKSEMLPDEPGENSGAFVLHSDHLAALAAERAERVRELEQIAGLLCIKCRGGFSPFVDRIGTFRHGLECCPSNPIHAALAGLRES